jgi:hypothetical protein
MVRTRGGRSGGIPRAPFARRGRAIADGGANAARRNPHNRCPQLTEARTCGPVTRLASIRGSTSG